MARGVGIDVAGLKLAVTGAAGATRAVGMWVGRYAVLIRVASAGLLDLRRGRRERAGKRDARAAAQRNLGAAVEHGAQLLAALRPLIGRIASIHDIASRKRGDMPGTMRVSIASASSCTARAVAGAGGTPNSR